MPNWVLANSSLPENKCMTCVLLSRSPRVWETCCSLDDPFMRSLENSRGPGERKQAVRNDGRCHESVSAREMLCSTANCRNTPENLLEAAELSTASKIPYTRTSLRCYILHTEPLIRPDPILYHLLSLFPLPLHAPSPSLNLA